MADNPYRVSLDDLARSTGHAPGGPTYEVEPELEAPHELPIRVTPMTPVSEIAAVGQLARARPGRRGAARVTGLVWLGLILLGVVGELVLVLTR